MNIKKITLFSLLLVSSSAQIKALTGSAQIKELNKYEEMQVIVYRHQLKKERKYRAHVRTLSDDSLEQEKTKLTETVNNTIIPQYSAVKKALENCQALQKQGLTQYCSDECEKFNTVSESLRSKTRKIDAIRTEIAKRQHDRIVNGAILWS